MSRWRRGAAGGAPPATGSGFWSGTGNRKWPVASGAAEVEVVEELAAHAVVAVELEELELRALRHRAHELRRRLRPLDLRADLVADLLLQPLHLPLDGGLGLGGQAVPGAAAPSSPPASWRPGRARRRLEEECRHGGQETGHAGDPLREGRSKRADTTRVGTPRAVEPAALPTEAGARSRGAATRAEAPPTPQAQGARTPRRPDVRRSAVLAAACFSSTRTPRLPFG